jgi:hypothetical protein
MSLPTDRSGVLLEDCAIEIGDGDAEIGGDGDAKATSPEAVSFRCNRDGCGSGCGQNCPGGVFGERPVMAGADAEDIITEGRNLQSRIGGRGLYAIGKRFELGLRCLRGCLKSGEEDDGYNAANRVHKVNR